MQVKESKDVTQKNLESFPDVAADILNVFIYEGRNIVKKGGAISCANGNGVCFVGGCAEKPTGRRVKI